MRGKRRYTHILRAVVAAAVTMAGASVLSQAQTFRVIYSFTGGTDGSSPSPPVVDNAGNLYGTASGGGYTGGVCGSNGCGTAFKLSNRGSGWVLNPLYAFQGAPDGASPAAGAIFGSNGSLYGTTQFGGGSWCYQGTTCGTAFNLRPAPTACETALCLWTETVLYRFGQQRGDGGQPTGIVFGQAGLLYGVTAVGGTGQCGPLPGGYVGCGTVYSMTPSGSGWMEQVLYSFSGGADGYSPNTGIVLDQSGNVYGTTFLGGNGYPGEGVVFQLTNSGTGWTDHTIHTFTGGSDGYWPGAVVLDNAGNLYGTARDGGIYGGGTIFELTPTGGGWNFNVIYNFPCNDCSAGPVGLLIDPAGNLYGTTWAAGAYGNGSVFKLSYSSGNWVFTDLYDFTGGSDGTRPQGLTLDAHGNLWGSADGGAYGSGVVFELTP